MASLSFRRNSDRYLAPVRTYINNLFRKATGLAKHIASCRWRRPGRNLRARSRLRIWTWRVIILFLAIFTAKDLVFPIVGRVYIPPRSKHPPNLRNGLLLVDTRPRDYPAAVDIVFVHGLGSFPDSTWQKPLPGQKSSYPLGISWIRDFLPLDIPQARLLFFNYDSTAYNDAPKKNLGDIANELLFSFENSEFRTTETEKKRPIIFLCHSYGGLVVKQALTQAVAAGERYNDLISNVNTLVFLGTPHFGTKYAGYAQELAVRLDRLGSNPDIFVPLVVNSTELQTLHLNFLQSFSELRIFNFYETRRSVIFKSWFWKWPISVMIVEKDSATFEAPNTENHHLDYDHSGLNKFNSIEDEGYMKILVVVRGAISKAIEERRHKQEEEEQLLHSNWKLPPQQEGNGTKQCLGPYHYLVPPRTVSSFIDRRSIMFLLEQNLQDIDELKDPPRSVALWGMGGAGKSQLALRYIEKHKHQFNPIIWVDSESPSSVVRSFARVFESLNLDYPSKILDEDRKHGQGHGDVTTRLKDDWVVKAVLQWLASRSEIHCPWLVVLDDADKLAWIRDIIPRGRRGSLIFTSRDRLVGEFANHLIYVGDLETGEAIDLLLQGVRIPTQFNKINATTTSYPSVGKPAWKMTQEQYAFSIVEKLGRSALAVNLANSFILQHDQIRENLTLYQDYLSDGSFAVVESKHPPYKDMYRFPIASVFETTYLAIQEISNISAVVLMLLAHLNHASLDDRLFIEATEARYFLIFFRQNFNYFLTIIKILACGLTPYYGIVFLVRILARFRPAPAIRTEGRFKRYVTTILTYQPLALNLIYMFSSYMVEVNRIVDGNVVDKDGALHPSFAMLLVLANVGYALPYVSDWLLGDKESPWYFRTLPILYTTTIIMWWAFKWFLYGLDFEVEKHTMALLSRLDFSKNDMFQFEAMISGLNRQTREQLGVMFVVDFSWLIIWNIIIKVLFIVTLVSMSLLWTYIVQITIARYMSEDNTRLAKFLLVALKFTTTPFISSFMANFVSFFVFYLLGYFGVMAWVPWDPKAKPELAIEPWILNSFLQRNKFNGWDVIPYSQAASVLTRFGLLQRSYEANQTGYIMHPLVQWWSQERLGPEIRKAYTKEAYRFLDLVYQSQTCWDDINCQQMLIPHLVSLATADAMNDSTQYVRMKGILRMLYRSLKKVGRI